MSEPFVGQIQIFPWAQAPMNYALCQGQSVPVTQNTTLWALIGNTYGGKGNETFNLPDLRGRVALQFDSNAYPEGSMGGEEAHVLTIAEMPRHNHALMTDATSEDTINYPTSVEVLGVSSGMQQDPVGTFPVAIYGQGEQTGILDPHTIAPAGGGQPHNNMMPYLTLNYSIAVKGIWPSPTHSETVFRGQPRRKARRG